eukprot:jgi/Mesvir1/8354/Mv12614-RA.1
MGNNKAQLADDDDDELARGDKSSAVRVVMRIRPLLKREYGYDICVELPDDETIVVRRGDSQLRTKMDRVLDQEASQEDLYRLARGHVMPATRGVNCTIFAYGQTGSGKTFSMLGSECEQRDGSLKYDFAGKMGGITPRAIRDIFAWRDTQAGPQGEWETVITCSFLQIYGDRLFDLLEPHRRLQPWDMDSRDSRKKHITGMEIREDPAWGMRVPQLSEHVVTSAEAALELVEKGAANRTQRQTEYNEHSSRSHSIFTLWIEQRPKGEGGGGDAASKALLRRSKLHLVDLAGSEKWVKENDSNYSAERISEMTAINKSLSCLGKCIMALTQGVKREFIPFRESKLTRLLADSLGGNAKTLILATASPSAQYADDTRSTAKFADAARQVLVSARVNDEMDEGAMISRQEKEIARLKQLLRSLTEEESALKGLNDTNRSLSRELEQAQANLRAVQQQIKEVEEELNRERARRQLFESTFRQTTLLRQDESSASVEVRLPHSLFSQAIALTDDEGLSDTGTSRRGGDRSLMGTMQGGWGSDMGPLATPSGGSPSDDSPTRGSLRRPRMGGPSRLSHEFEDDETDWISGALAATPDISRKGGARKAGGGVRLTHTQSGYYSHGAPEERPRRREGLDATRVVNGGGEDLKGHADKGAKKTKASKPAKKVAEWNDRFFLPDEPSPRGSHSSPAGPLSPPSPSPAGLRGGSKGRLASARTSPTKSRAGAKPTGDLRAGHGYLKHSPSMQSPTNRRAEEAEEGPRRPHSANGTGSPASPPRSRQDAPGGGGSPLPGPRSPKPPLANGSPTGIPRARGASSGFVSPGRDSSRTSRLSGSAAISRSVSSVERGSERTPPRDQRGRQAWMDGGATAQDVDTDNLLAAVEAVESVGTDARSSRSLKGRSNTPQKQRLSRVYLSSSSRGASPTSRRGPS